MSLGVHDPVESTTLFSCSRPPALARHLGIPCEAHADHAGRGVERLRTHSGAELLWAAPRREAPAPLAARVHARDASVAIFARLTDDRTAERLLAEHGGDWSRAIDVTDAHGAHLASLWRAGDGSVFLPFDPDEVCEAYWSESYLDLARGSAGRLATRELVRSYYRVRDLLPRRAQIWLRRRYARLQARSRFPGWPFETALHDFFALFTAILADVAGEPIPGIAPWPRGYSWAFVLTHDVETSAGLAALQPIVELERELGLRSSWNLVPRRYEVDGAIVRRLRADGFEVGVHGLYHDGRDLESLERVRERSPAMREAARLWEAVGFRSPATQRHWRLMPMLGFDYDSSYPDSDPFEPQGGGCCTWFPYFNQQLVELPLTMPQDHTLFVILGERDESAWVRKADFLRARGGLALIDTHPDYLVDERIASAYRRLLERYAADESAWKALPRDVSAWWRRRASSRLQRSGEGWMVSGPAAGEAEVRMSAGTAWS
jgi:hypothetical protein